MKILLTAGVVFTPGSQTLDFSGVSGFDLSRLYGVINATAGSKLYAPGITGFGYQSFANGVMTLEADTSQMAASDELLIAYESPDAQPVSAVSLPLPAGAAKDTSLQAILAAIQAQRVETIWTDDTGTRFIRLDSAGTITWTDVAGNASSAPGAGARPDSDSGTVVSRYTYRATAAGTGFASGDFLDHLVVTDGDAGDLVSNFWVNVTSGAKIAAPSAASITPLAPLPDGAATSTKQDTGNTSLASLLTGLGAPADTAATSDTGTFSLLSLLKRALGKQGTDPASPTVANAGTGGLGWLGTIAGLLRLGTATQANSASVTLATDLANLEPAGVKITAAAMPAGGVGLTGWLSAIWAALTTRSQYATSFSAFGTTAGGAPATGAGMAVGASPTTWSRIRATCLATATGGTFYLQGANDSGFLTGTLFLDSAPVTTAGVPLKLEAPAQYPFVRVVYVPGATNAANITAALSLHTA
ncbi:hypothetical protein [Methylobacterium sp. ARG-1]|uniref:hypothetical protein n=1 Tax=Methylobacterium sp. ARG-1 TaxID=1692501 RepID=UPI000680E49A|nr:hypothetical protein [Methylobacterium sp. ARG-1]KNY21606.1 hypothetical protein AKJ13_15240 [Methylobacterium sp. ARG-1]